jgi:hypothetical protein
MVERVREVDERDEVLGVFHRAGECRMGGAEGQCGVCRIGYGVGCGVTLNHGLYEPTVGIARGGKSVHPNCFRGTLAFRPSKTVSRSLWSMKADTTKSCGSDVIVNGAASPPLHPKLDHSVALSSKRSHRGSPSGKK